MKDRERADSSFFWGSVLFVSFAVDLQLHTRSSIALQCLSHLQKIREELTYGAENVKECGDRLPQCMANLRASIREGILQENHMQLFLRVSALVPRS